MWIQGSQCVTRILTMDVYEHDELRKALKEYTSRSTPLATLILSIDIILYIGLVAGAVILDDLLLKALCATGAGLAIGAIFVIGHDAVHHSYTNRKWLNVIIGHIALLPVLHNYSLWQIAHNRTHHIYTNLKGHNSWSPLSKNEYDSLPAWRKVVEQLYRTLPGLGIYYLVERWWKDKFFPTRRVVPEMEGKYWWDFALVLVYLVLFLMVLGYIGTRLPDSSALSAIVWGFLIPFVVWNYLMGSAVYLQHTNARVPWFDKTEDLELLGGEEEVTVYVRLPRWYGLISHEIMEHTAHHVHPKIPLYRLRSAQEKLADILGNRLVAEKFTPLYLMRTMARCKLYDYKLHKWQDFTGLNTTECLLPSQLVEQGVPSLKDAGYAPA
jgi:omega-6 fatty acid desaturase (delta-12 desaturase)